MDISSFIFGDQQEEAPDVSEMSVAKMYDRVTSKLISDTPGPGEAVQAIASVRPINPLAVMNGRYSSDDTMPSAIMRVQRAAALKEQRQTIALLGDMEAHEAAKQRIVNEQARLAFDKTKFFALQGAKGLGAVYKTYIDISAKMDEAQANNWLNALMEGDIDNEAPLVDEGEGRAYALRKLVEVGGIKQKRTPPKGFRYEGDTLVPEEGYLQGIKQQAEARRAPPRARETPGEAAAKEEARQRVRAKYKTTDTRGNKLGTLYRYENDKGEAVYGTAEEARGRKPAAVVTRGERSRFNFTPVPEKKEKLADPLGIR